MKDGRVTYRNKITDHTGEIIGQVNDCIVLNVGPFTHLDAIDVTAKNRPEPNAAFCP